MKKNGALKAFDWWDDLDKHKQNDLINETFGGGEWWEDNTLTGQDIIFMYKKYKLDKNK